MSSDPTEPRGLSNGELLMNLIILGVALAMVAFGISGCAQRDRCRIERRGCDYYQMPDGRESLPELRGGP